VTAAIAFVIVVAALAIPFAAAQSALSYPTSSWRHIGRSQTRWSVSFAIIPFGIAWLASATYFLAVRPHLVTATPPSLLAPGRQALARTPTGETIVTLIRPTRLIGMAAWVVSFSQADGTESQRRMANHRLEPLEDDPHEPTISVPAKLDERGTGRRSLVVTGSAIALLGSLLAVGAAMEDDDPLTTVVVVLGVAAAGLGIVLVLASAIEGHAGRTARKSQH